MFLYFYILFISVFISSTLTVAVPNFPTTIPAAKVANCIAKSQSAPAALAADNVEITLSQAPETS